ncbi:MAG: beta-ketoacyl-[acyl-carrier-protein] synthase family protein [Desulfobacteraceae bacterium]
MAYRVVITAMGFITSLGRDEETILKNLRSGKTQFQRSKIDPDVVINPVMNFDLKAITGPCKNRRYLNRGAAFSTAAALLAVQKSGLLPEQLSKAGLFVGTGPNLDMDGVLPRNTLGEMEWGRTPALWMLKFIANTPAALISQFVGINGENLTVQTACTAGLTAIGEAFHKIKDGYLQLALAGAGDSRLNLGGLMAYKKAQALFNGQGAADQACRPFDINRGGFVSGEGGAFFLLESLEHAMARKAPIMAEIMGYATSMDAHGMTAPHPEGTFAEKAVKTALTEAKLAPSEIQMISSHGTSTLANDAVEALVLKRIFGPHGPTIMALKSWIGHLSAACGAVELALSLICQKAKFWPHIRNLIQPCEPHLTFLQKDREIRATNVLLENFGFGGQNCALIIRKW